MQFDCVVCPVCSKAMTAIQYEEHNKIHVLEADRDRWKDAVDISLNVIKRFDEYWADCQRPSVHNNELHEYSICIVCDMRDPFEGKHDSDCPFELAHVAMGYIKKAMLGK